MKSKVVSSKSEAHLQLAHISGGLMLKWSLSEKSYYLDIRIKFFQIATNTWNGSTSSNPSNKYVNFAFCIFPNLRTSGLIMNLQRESV